MSICMLCTRLGCAQCKTPVGERTRAAYKLNKGNSWGSARNRAMVKDRQNTLGYVQHELALINWDGGLDENWQPPHGIRLGEVPHIKGK